MKNKSILITFAVIFLGLFSNCSISNHSMKTPNYHIEFYKTDFEYSKQVQAEAKSVRVFCVDWRRLFKWESGQIESDRFKDETQTISLHGNIVTDQVLGAFSTVVPVLGDYGKGKVSGYALYTLMQENPGYDVVIYPQYETKKFIIPFIYSNRTVKVTARLGKIK